MLNDPNAEFSIRRAKAVWCGKSWSPCKIHPSQVFGVFKGLIPHFVQLSRKDGWHKKINCQEISEKITK